MAPNWQRLARVNYDPNLHEALAALDLEIPWEGRPLTYRAFPDDAWVQAVPGGRGEPASHFIVRQAGGTAFQTASTLLRTSLGLSAGTPSAKALTAWLTLWGWPPPEKPARQVEPNDDTRAVI